MNPEQPVVPNHPADQKLDEHSGVYGFFRRHQKKLLYTAGLFTLLTFSITGPMLSAVDVLFGRGPDLPSIAIGGKRFHLTAEDYHYGEILARNSQTAVARVLPPIAPGEGGSSELSEVLAILRRAAIAEGIDVSMVEVDRAIEVVREQAKVESAAQLARLQSFASLAQYRELMREAMRVGTYVRLQTLALDCSDAKVLQQVMADREKITLRVATLDEKVLEEQIKAKQTVSEADLRKWLDGKDDREKVRIQVYDTNRLELRFGAALLAEGQFDPAEWQQDVLKDFQPMEDQLRAYYDQDKDLRFKLDGDKNYKPFEDVKAELNRLVAAEQVMNHVLGKLRDQLDAALKPKMEDLQRNQAEQRDADNAVAEQKAKLAEKPDDAAVAEQLRLAQEVAIAKKNAVDAATDAVKAARAAWDFPAAFAELTKDKKGFVQKAMSGRRSIEQLKDLDANDLGLGQWPFSQQANGLQDKGFLCFGPARTGKAVCVYQATDVELRPLKPWDQLRPLLEGAYFTELAKAEGETKKKTMEEALLRLAKAKMPEKVAEIEGKRKAKVDERLAEWERTTQQGIADAEKTLAPLAAGTQAQIAWQKKLDNLKAELGLKEQRQKEFDVEVGKVLEQEVADEAKKFHRDVLDAAAAEAGFTVADVGPHVRDLSRRPRFDKAFDPTVVFLFKGHSELKENESTGVLQDPTNRRWVVAVCTKVEPLTPLDVTRRDFESLRTGDGLFSFATQQAFLSYTQAFTKAALEKRYDFQRPVGEQKVVDGKKVDGK